MDCKHVDELLMDYLYQELDPTQAEHVEAHLQVCTRCAGELSAYERTRATVQGLPELEPPSRIDELLLREAARAVRLQPEPAPGFWQRVRESLRVMVLHPAMTAAVTLVVVLGVSFYIYRNSEPPSSAPMIESTPAPLETAATEKREGEAARSTVPATAQPQLATEEKAQKETDKKLAEVEARLQRDQAERPTAGLRRGVARVDRQAGRASTRELLVKSPAGPAARASTGSPYGNAYDEESLGKGDGYGKGVLAAKPRATRARKPTAVAASVEPKLAPKAEPQAAPPAAKVAKAEAPAEPKKAPVYKKKLGKSAGADDLDALVMADKSADERAPRSKLKLGQAAGGGGKQSSTAAQQQVLAGGMAKGKDLSGEQWMHQGMIAQKMGKCDQALAYYDRALAVEPKLAGKLSSLVRTCAATLNESALTVAKKVNPRLSGMLGLEVARRARLRQLDAESVDGKAVVAQKRKAAPAKKAAAKPAKANANINKGNNSTIQNKATEAH